MRARLRANQQRTGALTELIKRFSSATSIGVLVLMLMAGNGPAWAESVEALLGQCEMLEHNDPNAAIAVAERVLGDSTVTNPVSRARALNCKGHSLAVIGRLQDAIALMENQHRAEVLRVGDPGIRARLLIRGSGVFHRASDNTAAMAVVEEAMALAEREQLSELIPFILGSLAMYQADAGMHERALANHQRSIALPGADGDLRQMLPLHYNLGLTLRYQGQHQEALEVLQPLVSQLEAPGMEVRLASLLAVIGGLKHLVGEDDKALELFERSSALHQEFDNPAERAALLRDMARLQMARGSLDEALELAETALALAERSQAYLSVSASLKTMVDVLAAIGDLERALDLHQTLLARQTQNIREQQDQRLTELEAELGLQRQAVELEQLRREREVQAMTMDQQRLLQRLTTAALLVLALAALGIFLWQRANNRKLAMISRTDSLTGLPNRRYMTALLRFDNARPADRYSVLFLVDLDHFKRINDSFGHDVGDRALLAVSHFLAAFAKNHRGEVGRWGGEEFCLLLPRLNRSEVEQRAAELIKGIAAVEIVDNRGASVPISASVGFAPLEKGQAHSGQEDWEPAFIVADQLLYKAKRQGRQRALGLWPDANQSSLDPNAMEQQLAKGDFKLVELNLGEPPH